nr:DUF4238 domain-containing protein [Herbiconiux sp. SALV-R1]
MPTPRGHHVISKFYLRHFAATDGRITRVDLGGDTVRRVRAHVKSATVVRDLYVIEGWNGSSPLVEKMFATTEDKAAKITARVIRDPAGAWPLDGDSRVVLSHWLSQQFLRAPLFRLAAERAIRAGLDSSDRHIHFSDLLERGTVTGDPGDLDRLARRFGISTKSNPIPANEYYELLRDHLNPLARHLFEQQWFLGIAKEPSFFVADSPIVLTTSTVDESDGVPFQICSLDYLKSRWSWTPFNRNLLILTRKLPPALLRANPDQIIHLSKAQIEQQHMLQAANATKSIYEHPDDRFSTDIDPEQWKLLRSRIDT